MLKVFQGPFAINPHNICVSLSGKYHSESLTVKKTEAKKLLVNRGRRRSELHMNLCKGFFLL